MPIQRIWRPSPNKSAGSSNRRIIVLHISAGARTNASLANFICNSANKVSYHISVDNEVPNTCYEYVRLPETSWSVASYNSVSVNGCFCEPGEAVNWSRQQWLNRNNAFNSMAQWVKEQAARSNIPLVALTPAQAQGSGRGVCQHRDLGVAGGNHSDCGVNFPMDELLKRARGDTAPIPPQPIPPKPKLLNQEDLSMLVTFGSNRKANLPLPNNVISLRLVCAQGGTLVVRWMGTGKSERKTLTETTRWDYTIPKDQQGYVQLEDEGLAGPLYVTWIQPLN